MASQYYTETVRGHTVRIEVTTLEMIGTIYQGRVGCPETGCNEVVKCLDGNKDSALGTTKKRLKEHLNKKH